MHHCPTSWGRSRVDNTVSQAQGASWLCAMPVFANRTCVVTLPLIATQLGRRGGLCSPLQVQIIPEDVKLSNYGKSLCVKGKIAEKFMYYLQFY